MADRSLIPRDVTPCGHKSPFRRIDVRHPGRKTVITRHEIEQIGGREPDLAIYNFNFILDCWTLKDGM